jgi:diaminopimelate epimerase
MNGAGNDFVIIDNRSGRHTLDGRAIARLCDRHRGVGADGLLAVEKAQNGGDYRMRYYNADGGEAEMCGNGARCFARYAGRLGQHAHALTFETMAGKISAELVGEQVKIRMSEPGPLTPATKLKAAGGEYTVHAINTGVPHAIVVVDNLANVDVQTIGSALRWHEHFAPKGTNANFVQTIEPGLLAIRTYERGVEGETLACGTGVVASAIVHHALTGAPPPLRIKVQGGDVLEVGFEVVNGAYKEATLCGPADFVFEGEVVV